MIGFPQTKNIMKVQGISDTHNFHSKVVIDNDVDLIIHAGDETNHPNPHINKWEFVRFLNWFHNLDIRHKIFSPRQSFSLHSTKYRPC